MQQVIEYCLDAKCFTLGNHVTEFYIPSTNSYLLTKCRWSDELMLLILSTKLDAELPLWGKNSNGNSPAYQPIVTPDMQTLIIDGLEMQRVILSTKPDTECITFVGKTRIGNSQHIVNQYPWHAKRIIVKMLAIEYSNLTLNVLLFGKP
jgi:hypothetical protein